MAGLRAMAGRGLLVGLAALPLGVALALVLRVPTVVAFAWVLPGLALAGLVLLAGTTRVDPAYVATGLGAAWAIAVTLPSFHGSPAGLEVAHRLAEPAVQLLTLAVAVTAVGLVAARRDKLSYRRQA
jgi:hypothetical protein